MDRMRQLLQFLSKDARIIEIALDSRPVAPKCEGWKTTIVGRASRDGLSRGYRDRAIEPVEEVDFVWSGGSVADVVPADRHGTFDAFIARHVIEHTTDLVAFLRAAEALLRPDGVVILAVPDKREGRDFFRYPSATADAIAAFVGRHERHTVRALVDSALSTAVRSGTEGAWAVDELRPAAVLRSATEKPDRQGADRQGADLQAADLQGADLQAAANPPEDSDTRPWVFVPASFSLMILELSLLGYLDLRVERLLDLDSAEFLVWLRKGAAPASAEDARRERVVLMERVIVELAEQSRHLPDSPLSRSVSHATLQEQLLKASYRVEAMRTVLSALRESTRRFGFDRLQFQRRIRQWSGRIPDNAYAAVRHRLLLAETRRVLDPGGAATTSPDDAAIAFDEGDGHLVVPLSAAQFGAPLLALEFAREKHRSRALRTVLYAVLASLRPRALDKKRFKSIIREVAQGTPDSGVEAVQHVVLYEETNKVLGIKADVPA